MDKATFSTSGAPTSPVIMEIQGSKRKMKAYTITETEFLSMPYWRITIDTSDKIIFSCISFAIGLIVQSCFCETLTPNAKAILVVGLILSVGISLIALYMRKKLKDGNKTIEDIIKTETIHENYQA